MFGRGGRRSVNALLQKANSQLKGEIPAGGNEDDDDENLDAYLNSLSRRATTPTAQPQIQWDKFGEVDDLSLTHEENSPKGSLGGTTVSGAGSKFLKKKKTSPQSSPKQAQSKTTKPAKKSTAAANNAAAQSVALSKATAYNTKYSTGRGAKNATSSAALSKAAAAAAHDKRYHAGLAKSAMPLSDSDMDLSLSMDEDVVADVKTWKSGPEAKTWEPEPRKSKVLSSKQYIPKGQAGSRGRPQSASDDDSSSMQLGRGGNKFLKKKKQSVIEVPDEGDDEDYTRVSKKTKPEKNTVKPKSQFALKSAEKHSTKVALDTDEESLADFIGGLSGTSSGERTPRTPRGPRGIVRTPRITHTPTIEELSEDDEYADHQMAAESDVESLSSSGSFKMNIMDLGDLEPIESLTPATQKSSGQKVKTEKDKKRQAPATKASKLSSKEKTSAKKEKTSSDDIFSALGLQTVEDLLGPSVGSAASDEDDEIHTARTSDVRTEISENLDSEAGRAPTPLKSILTTTPRLTTPRSARGRSVRLAEVTDVRTRSRSPSPEVISTARGSRTASVVYTDEFDEESMATENVTSVKTEQSSDQEDDYHSEYSYSEDFTETHSGRGSPRRTPRKNRRKSEEYYSDDFTSTTDPSRRRSRWLSRTSSRDSMGSYSEDYTSYSDQSRSPSPDLKPRKPAVKTKSRQVQTGLDVGLLYQWNTATSGMAASTADLGMTFVDPTPIATHVVSAEALEALTAYSPSVIALNDMLRQQLQLTTQFIQMQKRLHDSYASAMPTEHHYTTLADTKRYIKKNKKSVITFDQALKQVKTEMGMN